MSDSISASMGSDSISASTEAASSAVPPTVETVTIKVTGAVGTSTTALKGTKLNDALLAAGIDRPTEFTYRRSGKAFSATAVLESNVELTATAKAAGG